MSFRTLPILASGSCFSRKAADAVFFWWTSRTKSSHSRAWMTSSSFCAGWASSSPKFTCSRWLFAHDHYASALEVAYVFAQGLVVFLERWRAFGADDTVAGARAGGVGFLVATGPRVGFARAVDGQALFAIFQKGVGGGGAAGHQRQGRNQCQNLVHELSRRRGCWRERCHCHLAFVPESRALST